MLNHNALSRRIPSCMKIKNPNIRLKVHFYTSVRSEEMFADWNAHLADAYADPHHSGPCVERKTTVFDSAGHMPISLGDYLRRISTFGQLSEHFIYADVLRIMRAYISQTKLCCAKSAQRVLHRLCIAAAYITCKFRDDLYDTRVDGTGHWAKVGGISKKELCRLERHLLHVLDWRVFPLSHALDEN